MGTRIVTAPEVLLGSFRKSIADSLRDEERTRFELVRRRQSLSFRTLKNERFA